MRRFPLQKRESIPEKSMYSHRRLKCRFRDGGHLEVELRPIAAMESEKVLQRTSSLLQNTALSDVTFIVGPPSASKKYVGHRVLLAMTSPVFEAMFYGDMADKSKVIRITDLAPIGFENLLRYAYTDTLNLTSVEDAMLTAYAAKKYLLPHLLRECFVFIEAHVSPKNVCQVYEFAAVLEAHHLIYECLNIIDRQTHHVLTCSTFPSISVSTLETIVGRPYLNIYSEFSLYSAVHLWAEEECKRRNVEIEMENLRIVLDSVLPHVRFLAMTAEEFCKGPAKNGLLSKDECYAIFMNLAIPGIVPMPKGLSSDMTKRAVPPDFFIATRFSPSGFHSPVRPVKVCGIRFTVTNHDIFLVGVGFPVRLDTNYFSVRQPKFEGSLRFLYKIQEDKIEREDMSVSFSLAREKDVRLRLRKTYFVRKGVECELELHVNSMLAEDVVVPNMRNRKKEDTVDGITFHFHQFNRGQASNASEILEFSELYYYF